MVTRWHLLHLPIRVSGQQRTLGFADELIVRWPDAVIEGFRVRVGVSRWFVPRQIVRVAAVALEISDRRLMESRPRKWWLARPEYWDYANQPIFEDNGNLVGRIKDLMIDEKTLAVHQVVISRGLLADLITGTLRIPVHHLREDEAGRIKIGTGGAF